MACREAIPPGTSGARLVVGDFNLLEPDHTPHYRFFQEFEYDFYRWLGQHGYRDAFRTLHPEAAEYSWVGRTGDGYRYDYAHISVELADVLLGCTYLHGPRTGALRLTDHSALSVRLGVTARQPRDTCDPTSADALF